jgi:hypothetical protein
VAKKGLFDNMFDRLDDVDREVRKVARRTLTGKNGKKKGGGKWEAVALAELQPVGLPMRVREL